MSTPYQSTALCAISVTCLLPSHLFWGHVICDTIRVLDRLRVVLSRSPNATTESGKSRPFIYKGQIGWRRVFENSRSFALYTVCTQIGFSYKTKSRSSYKMKLPKLTESIVWDSFLSSLTGFHVESGGGGGRLNNWPEGHDNNWKGSQDERERPNSDRNSTKRETPYLFNAIEQENIAILRRNKGQLVLAFRELKRAGRKQLLKARYEKKSYNFLRDFMDFLREK